MATVKVVKAFTLIRDDGRPLDVAVGTQELDDTVANHWFALHHIEAQEPTYNAESDSDDAPEKRKPGRPKSA
ncbi:MAG: STY1053 family phage-associated protein [Janthinobacterium lividum]